MKKRRDLKLLQSLAKAIVLGALSTLLGLTPVNGAQPSSNGYALAKGTNEFSLWAGGSPDSFGNIEDRQMLLIGLGYGRILAAWDWVSLEYTLDLSRDDGVRTNDVRTGSSRIYGAGLSPLGFKLRFAQQSWIKPFLAASVEFLYFQHDIPRPDTSRFNFTADLGLGVDFFVTLKTALTIGYKLHHISNFGIGSSNPGLTLTSSIAVFLFLLPSVRP